MIKMRVIPIILVLIVAFIAQYIYFQQAVYQPLYSPRVQNEITEYANLLNKDGRIIREGWARRPFWRYDRNHIKDITKLRIKEWDYYSVISQKHKFAISATISDLSYGGLLALNYVDLENGTFYQIDAMEFFTFGKMNLSAASNFDNVVEWSNSNFSLHFERRGQSRHLILSAPNLKISGDRVGLWANLTLFQASSSDTMNIATSWEEDRTAFYLNEKVNCMKTLGNIKLGNSQTIRLHLNDAFAVLDWGRGKWTYENRWYWCSVSGVVNGTGFGLNLGYGFSDRSSATENVIIYNDKIHKLDEVVFNIPVEYNNLINYTRPWTITSNNGRLYCEFKPILDRSSTVNLVVIRSEQHQVFGKFSGNATLDDGKFINFHDIYGFAEDVLNRW